MKLAGGEGKSDLLQDPFLIRGMVLPLTKKGLFEER